MATTTFNGQYLTSGFDFLESGKSAIGAGGSNSLNSASTNTTRSFSGSEKRYFEVEILDANTLSNSFRDDVGLYAGSLNSTGSGSLILYRSGGRVATPAGTVGDFATYGDGDRIGFAVDFGNKKIWIAKNNTWLNSGNPASGTNAFEYAWSGDAYIYVSYELDSSIYVKLRTDSANFFYTPPSGFSAWDAESRTLDANAGSYSLTGQSASLSVGRVLSLGAGSYVVSGHSVNLAYSNEPIREPRLRTWHYVPSSPPRALIL